MKPEAIDLISALLLGTADATDRDGFSKLPEDAKEQNALLHDLGRVVTALPYALAPQHPPAFLKEKILALTATEPANSGRLEMDTRKSEVAGQGQTRQPGAQATQLWKQWQVQNPATDFFLQRAHEGEWETTAVPGVEVKKLYVDHQRDYVTMLVRMAAGSSYPSHRHGGFEECYVLQGDLHVGDTVMHAGDYQRAENQSVHVVQSTQTGCLLFIVSSQHDELLA